MLLEVAAKVIGKIISTRLTGLLLRDGNGMEEQCGFLPGRGCPDAFFSLKMALKKRKEHNLDSWVLFIDLIKAFDTVPHAALWAVLRRRGIPPRLLSRIRALHTDVKVTLPVGDASTCFGYTIGVKQGDSLAPVLFLYYVQAVLETLDRSAWETPSYRFKMDDVLHGRSWRARGPSAYTFSFPYSVYADDTALVFASRADLVRATGALRTHFKRWGLSIHVGTSTKKSKTECMVVPRPRTDYADYDTSDIVLADGTYIHFTRSFRYLGVVLSSSINDEADVDSRIAAASGAFATLEAILLSRHVKPHAKRAAYVSIVLPILLYGCEAWCPTESMLSKLRRFHNYSTRRMCHLSRRYCRFNHISAKHVRRRLGLLDIDTYITRRHLRWLGHVARMPADRLPRRFLTSWVRHKRLRGCPHFTYGRGAKKSLKKFGIPWSSWYHLAQDRDGWRTLLYPQATH